MTGIAVDTTRLSSETMNSAIEVIANVQMVVVRSVISSSFRVLVVISHLSSGKKESATSRHPGAAALDQAVRPGLRARERVHRPSAPSSRAPFEKNVPTTSGDSPEARSARSTRSRQALRTRLADLRVVARGPALQHQHQPVAVGHHGLVRVTHRVQRLHPGLAAAAPREHLHRARRSPAARSRGRAPSSSRTGGRGRAARCRPRGRCRRSRRRGGPSRANSVVAASSTALRRSSAVCRALVVIIVVSIHSQEVSCQAGQANRVRAAATRSHSRLGHRRRERQRERPSERAIRAGERATVAIGRRDGAARRSRSAPRSPRPQSVQRLVAAVELDDVRLPAVPVALGARRGQHEVLEPLRVPAGHALARCEQLLEAGELRDPDRAEQVRQPVVEAGLGMSNAPRGTMP